jgi:Rrf2 family nitric oxide-sensitive transcriptional repressor
MKQRDRRAATPGRTAIPCWPGVLFKFAFQIHIIGVIRHVNGQRKDSGTTRRSPLRLTVHLTQFSDYGLRLAIFLGCHPGRPVSVDEVGRAFGISRHHLVKVVQKLTDLGVVDTQRGRGGGMRLVKEPAEINVGWLVRQTEPHFNVVECFEPATNTCPIAPACGLKHALSRAQRAFLAVLDEYRLDQILTRRNELVSLLQMSPAPWPQPGVPEI